ncbi:MAG: thioredoxin family protein [Methanosarcinaceae archaeon]|nr:thioredoxin family protein [Methanosarcinaceae archaeon]
MNVKTLVLTVIVLVTAMTLSGCTEKPQQMPIVSETNVYPDIGSAFNTGKPVVVYFNEAFCSNCKDQQPIVESISNTVGNRAAVVVMDRALNEEFAAKYGVTNAPNMIIFDSNEEFVSNGYLNSDELAAIMSEL